MADRTPAAEQGGVAGRLRAQHEVEALACVGLRPGRRQASPVHTRQAFRKTVDIVIFRWNDTFIYTSDQYMGEFKPFYTMHGSKTDAISNIIFRVFVKE